MIAVDLTINQKQSDFFNEVFKAVAGQTNNRYFIYGGAIRGGKTFVCLAILIALARKYSGSRWHIIRDSFTTLEQTTIPSFEKILPQHSAIVRRYNRNKANFFVELINGSQIFFISESFYSDPDLTWMLGMETNGIFLEQIEGLQEATFEQSLQRIGSWIIEPMPIPIILSTFNPTQNWIKAKIYDKWVSGELTEPYFYMQALPNDNPTVTTEQWEAWKRLDPINYRRFVEGSWDAFAVNNPFAYAFDKDKHTGTVEPDESDYIELSFDFNVDPITCIAAQSPNLGKINVFKEFRLQNSDIYELCNRIKAAFPNQVFIITGDATGHNRSALAKGNINYYTVIKQELRLVDTQMKQPAVNPAHEDARVLLNSILQNGEITIDESLKYLIEDLMYCEVNEQGELDKHKDKHRSHLLDCLLYHVNTFHKKFLKM